VGILFLILEMLFKPFRVFSKKRSRAALYKTIFILIVIWLYACLSGMSPSVMRSAVMFTFLALGRLYDRHIDSFNIIFISVIPLLIFNPWQIMQVGFQLSYLAVAGIVFYQPLISKLWRPSNRFLKYIWSLTTVSIAAQLATAPVSLYYFHQFPNYFLISNMVAIPVSFTVLIFGVALFVLGNIPYLGDGVGFLLDWNLRILNATVVTVDKFPHAVTEHIYISLTETILFYLAAITAGAFAVLKQKKYFIFLLVLILASTISISYRTYQNNHRQEIIFYQTKSSTAMAVKHGTQAFIFTDSDTLEQSADFTYHLSGDLNQDGIHHPGFININQENILNDTTYSYYHFPFLFVGNTSFYFLTKSTQQTRVTHADEIDYVIITGNPFLQIDSLAIQFNRAIFIIDNQNSWKSHNYWVKTFDRYQVQYVSVKRDGGFVIPY